MEKTKMKTKSEAYIEKRQGVRGGAPVIAGTGVKVLNVAVRYEVMDMSPEEIMVALPHLDLSQIHAALAYYYAHKADLDQEWKASLKKVARLRAGQVSILEQKLGAAKYLQR
jgi:uncharacterized protein (DUF433 family)